MAALVLIAGCAPKKPADVSDAGASLKWIGYSLSEKAKGASSQEVFDHARELQAAHVDNTEVASFLAANEVKLAAIPQAVCSAAIAANDLKKFQWALEQDATVTATPEELASLWSRNPDWQNLALEKFPTAMAVFMNEAVKDMNLHFFEKHVAEFDKAGRPLPPPLTADEYRVSYIHLLGIEGLKAARANDAKRIEFLLDHAPAFDGLAGTTVYDKKNLQKLADHLLYDMKNEALLGKLVALGYVFEGFDLEKIDYNSALVKGLMANPPQAIRVLGLDQPGDPLSLPQIRFLTRMPIKKQTNLHPDHIHEAILMCMEAGGSDQAIEFIQLKAAINPLTRDDYVELMGWGVQFNDLKILSLIKKHGGGISIQDLDLYAIASNQRAFERYAPARLENLEPTMDLEGETGGVTYGKIKQILGNENPKAGLFIVRRLDIGLEWKSMNNSRTLLMDACAAGNLDVARYLIEKRKADVNATTKYSTAQTTLFGQAAAAEGRMSAIFFAAQSGNTELIHYLKSQGANINAVSHFGATPLMLAVSEGHLEAVKTLLELGANVNAQMKEELKGEIYEGSKGFSSLRNAYQRAKSGGHEEIMKVLEQAGAQS
ncbi:ankyrin repeat domain-containing protein [Pontiellaceae bacterium B12227]|nr:ankyrin repeat domain-containing protein [Pontiellaceae bacterium B12227]